MTDADPRTEPADGSNLNSSLSPAGASDPALRRRAEETVARDANTVTPQSLIALSPEAAAQVLHELRVHQIELEMQNEELRRTQMELEASRTRYFDLYDLAPIGYFTLSAHGIIQDVNLTAADLLNVTRSALIKQPLSNFVSPQDQDLYYRHMRAMRAIGTIQVWEMQMLRQGSGSFWARFEASAHEAEVNYGANRAAGDGVECRAVMSDISARKKAEGALQTAQAELEQQARLAAVGQLAAGVAHDFNNILSVILLHGQLGMRNTTSIPALLAHFEIITQQAKRAANLVQQILDFSRRTILQMVRLDLVSFLQEQVEFWRRTISENIDIQLHAPMDACVILADSTRMQQMFANLVLNARDAMPDGGILRIDVDVVHVGPGHAVPLPQMDVGEWVCIQVRDNGIGMSDEVLTHIFEPFFTTKTVGMGTGLGLAQVYGIIKQHHGHIDIQTKLGAGTSFTIYLPRRVGILPGTALADAGSLLSGHGETILVVEDNAALAAAMTDVLQELNYHTLTAANGREALSLLEQQAHRIALVVSDLLMPDIGGQALFEAMRAAGLTMPFVMLTGYLMENELQALQAQGLFGWLLKPLDSQQLAELVARALR